MRAVEDMEQWILDMEGQMSSEDMGKHLLSVNILIKKHAVSKWGDFSTCACACVCVGGGGGGGGGKKS